MSSAEVPPSLRQGQFHYFPVAPGRLEFAEEVRKCILRERPQVVAVELPSTLEAAYLRAVERLPEMSVILYDDRNTDHSTYIPIEITDPFVEAIRSAQEVGAGVSFVDPDIGERPHLPDVYPDPYAVRRLGYLRYVEAYRTSPQSLDFDLLRHASGIAWKLQSSDPLARILVVVSLNLLAAVMEAMKVPQAEPLARGERRGIQVLNLHPECLAEVLEDYPFLQAVYEMRRYGYTWDESGSPPGGRGLSSGQATFEVIAGQHESSKERLERIIRRTARHVGWMKGETLKGNSAPVESGSEQMSSESLDSADLNFPTRPERFRFMDRQRVNFSLFGEAERQYENNTREKLAHWQRRLFARFSRNLALADHHLVAGLFDQTVAARSVVDDNFAWELWELASAIPFQCVQTDLTTVSISGEELDLGTKKIRLRRRLPRQKAMPKPIGLRGRKREKFPGEWAQQLDGSHLCSYPPEDILIENYGLFLKKKGKSILSEERSRTEPFTNSLLDGVDIRETLRNWHEGRLYVREYQKVSGEVGAVVVVFEDDRENHYPWCMTWLGEHSQESDMAFYSTDPLSHPVGPGIARAEYGGFLLSYPPRRMQDVWHDPDYWFAESKPEILLLAALDYTLEKFVVFVAARPPRSIFRTIASRLGRKIIFIPIGQLSPISMKKIRVVHVLPSPRSPARPGAFVSACPRCGPSSTSAGKTASSCGCRPTARSATS